jgi:hypothetical protein
MDTIYDSLIPGPRVRKIMRVNTSFVVLSEKADGGRGFDIEQHQMGFYDNKPFILPPDLLGLDVMDIVCSGEHGNPCLLLSDGSQYERGGHDAQWMKAHGYLLCPQTTHIIDPNNHVYRQAREIIRHRRTREDGPSKYWQKVASLPGRPLKVVGDSMAGNHCFVLMEDGSIIPVHDETGRSFKITPWSDESFRFKDIVAGRMSVTGITTDGQIVSHMMLDDTVYWADHIYWPLPDDCVAEFFDTSLGMGVRMRDGRTVYYTGEGDWSGTCSRAIRAAGYIPYPSLIKGNSNGEWIRKIGAMISVDKRWRMEKQAPPGIRVRSVVKTAQLLGEM